MIIFKYSHSACELFCDIFLDCSSIIHAMFFFIFLYFMFFFLLLLFSHLSFCDIHVLYIWCSLIYFVMSLSTDGIFLGYSSSIHVMFFFIFLYYMFSLLLFVFSYLFCCDIHRVYMWCSRSIKVMLHDYLWVSTYFWDVLSYILVYSSNHVMFCVFLLCSLFHLVFYFSFHLFTFYYYFLFILSFLSYFHFIATVHGFFPLSSLFWFVFTIT